MREENLLFENFIRSGCAARLIVADASFDNSDLAEISEEENYRSIGTCWGLVD